MPPAPESSQPDFDEVRQKADEFARHAYADEFARFERLRSGLEVNAPMDLATVDKLLTTTRTVRKRLDFTRAVDHEVIQRVSKLLCRHPLAGTTPPITSSWSPMQPNVLLLLPSTNEHTWRCTRHSGKRRFDNRIHA